MLSAFLRSNMSCETSKPLLILPCILLSSSESEKKKKSCMINTGQMIMDSVQGSVYWQIQVKEQITVLHTRVECLDISAFALSSSNLFVLFDWFPLEACSSLKRKRKVSRSWGEGKWRVASISREWQNCGLEVLCVWRIYFQLKNLMWK